MKFFAGSILMLALLALSAMAQGPARGRMEPVRDETLEVQAKHNLEIARWYLTKRKAYEGARSRLLEIVDTYPDFSRMDEVLYWLGEASLKLDKKEAAADYFKKMLKEFPGSEFVKKARLRLDELKVAPDEGDKSKG